jgi:hypothetical protein
MSRDSDCSKEQPADSKGESATGFSRLKLEHLQLNAAISERQASKTAKGCQC